MRLLYISEHFDCQGAGTSNYTMNILRNIANLGNKVYLLTDTPNDSLKRNEWLKFENYNIYLPSKTIKSFNTRISRRLFAFKVKELLVKKNLIDRIKPDVIHVLYGHTVSGILNYIPNGIRKFWTIHNVPPSEYTLPKCLNLPVAKEYFKKVYFSIVEKYHSKRILDSNADLLISISSSTKKKLMNIGIPAREIFVVPNGVDSDSFYPISKNLARKFLNYDPGIFIMLTVAGVTPHKGQINVINIMPYLKNCFERLWYINIGNIRDKYYYSLMKQKISEYGLQKNCFFLNDISQKDLNYFYNACDVYLQPSSEEGFCLSALEALGTGKRVLGSSSGALPDFANKIGAMTIVNFDNIKEVVKFVLAKSKFSFAQRERIHELVKKYYSWEDVAIKLLNIYRGNLKL